MLKCDYDVTPILLYGERKPKVILMIGSLHIYCDLSMSLQYKKEIFNVINMQFS